MKAFVTGSRAYGTPRDDSDIDLVVLVSRTDLIRLAEMVGDPEAHYGTMTEGYLRFGTLNLLCVTTERDCEVWRQGTEELIARRPVTRDEAVELFKIKQAEARAASGFDLEAQKFSIGDFELDPVLQAWSDASLL